MTQNDDLTGVEPADIFEVTRDEDEHAKYVAIWDERVYRNRSPAEVIMHHILPHFKRSHAAAVPTVIDFGVGTGRALARIQDANFNVLGIDIAGNCLDQNLEPRIPLLRADLAFLPQCLQADYGLCVDVLEHIKPQYLNAVLGNIRDSIIQGCFIRVANFSENHGPRYGKGVQLHQIFMGSGEWKHALLKVFGTVEQLDLDEDKAPTRYSFWCY